MRFFAIQLILFSLPTFAGQYENRYRHLFLNDVRDAQHLAMRFRSHDKTLCPTIKNKQNHLCLRDFLSRQTIRSSSHLAGLIKSIVEVSVVNPTGDKTEDLMNLCENLLVVVEKIKLEEFYLYKTKPEDELEREERTLYQKTDEKILARLKSDTLKKVQDKLNEAYPTKAQRPRMEHLRKRIAGVRNSIWVYPNDEVREPAKTVEFKTMILSKPDINGEWCSHYSVGKCFNYEFADCNEKLAKALRECGQNRSCAVGKWVRQSQVMKKMSKEKECEEVFVPFTAVGASG